MRKTIKCTFDPTVWGVPFAFCKLDSEWGISGGIVISILCFHISMVTLSREGIFFTDTSDLAMDELDEILDMLEIEGESKPVHD